MSTPQTGIFALGTASHAYLEFDLRPGTSSRDLVAALANLREPRTTMGGINLVSGFRPELWRVLSGRAGSTGAAKRCVLHESAGCFMPRIRTV
jgi:putative iron-dependent peroxidase